jgi:uncharacterized surface protein with fasciclin (FAS1) repeats
MRKVQKKAVAAANLAAITVVGLSACSSGTPTPASSSSASGPISAASPATGSTSAEADPAAQLVGTGCAGYTAQVPTGPGSVAGMAQAPVAVAVSNNPLLTTLAAALSGKLNPNVNLVDTLDGGQFTVFAPIDDAFAKIAPAKLDALKTDSKTLTAILTFHVVPGQLSPNEVDGTQPTVEGDLLTVTGSGANIKVNDASVICGGLQTANATVYLIDTVLMPGPKGLHPDSWHGAGTPRAGDDLLGATPAR